MEVIDLATGRFLAVFTDICHLFSIYNVYSSGSVSQNLVSLRSYFYGAAHPSAMYHLLPRITVEMSLPLISWGTVKSMNVAKRTSAKVGCLCYMLYCVCFLMHYTKFQQCHFRSAMMWHACVIWIYSL